MTYNELDTVVLKADIPTHGLRQGDVGTVVFVYNTEAVEVEFVLPNGHTQALLTLRTEQLRPTNHDDVFGTAMPLVEPGLFRRDLHYCPNSGIAK